MEQLLEKIDRLKAEYEALLPMSADNRKKLDKKIRLEFNYNSNHIEGNTLTYGETELLLIFDDTKGGHTMREYEEMKAHDVTFQLIQEWAEDPRPISEADICNLNKILLVRPYWKDALTPDGQPTRRQIQVGKYKQYPNSVRLENGEIFEYASPEETPILMGELMAWYQAETEKRTSHALLLAAMMHYKFVRIHPFDDGNGRVSRLLMNYVLFRHGFPPVIIKSTDKANYLRALNLADTGDTEAFVRYIGEQLVWSLELCIKAAKGENLEEPDDLDKELAVLQKQLSTKSALEEKATPENIADAVEKNLIPLFQMVEEKLAVLKSIFFETGIHATAQFSDDPTFANGDSWNTIIDNWLNIQLRGQNRRLSGLSYQYSLKGFKGAIAGPSYSIYLPVQFGEYNYSINKVHYPYAQYWTKEQMQQIIAPLIKDLLEQIKNTAIKP